MGNSNLKCGSQTPKMETSNVSAFDTNKIVVREKILLLNLEPFNGSTIDGTLTHTQFFQKFAKQTNKLVIEWANGREKSRWKVHHTN